MFFNKNHIKHTSAYIGEGNMWFFDKKLMKQVASIHLPKDAPHHRWGADMESYAIAHTCHIYQVPFSGFYLVSNSDYYHEPYNPEDIATQFQTNLVELVSKFVKQI